MSIGSRLRDTVTVKAQSATSTDVFGNPTYASANTDYPALVQQASELEIQNDRETRITMFNVYLLPDTDVSAIDKLVWHGKTLEVLGDPDVQENHNGPALIVLKARLVTA